MGVAYADYDNDGRLDFILGNVTEEFKLFQNVTQVEQTNGWLTIRLDGEGGPFNRDAIGARVYLTTDDGKMQMQEVKSGSSMGAGNDLALHFGLGETNITSVMVRWPDGFEETIEDVPVNQIWELSYLQAAIALWPTSLSSTQLANTISVQTLDVGNVGGRDLTWQIEEDSSAANGGVGACDAPVDIPWLSVNPDTGITPPGQTDPVEVTFDSTGLSEGDYTGKLCVTSNDPVNPLIEVDLSLMVTGDEDEIHVFLPIMIK
jgi:hypothetical protein